MLKNNKKDVESHKNLDSCIEFIEWIWKERGQNIWWRSIKMMELNNENERRYKKRD